MNESKKRAVIFTVAITQFTMPFMFSSIGIALPVIGHEFGASGLDLSLVESIYIGSVAALLLPLGRLADMYGKQPMFRLGTLIYALATFVLGFANSIEAVIGLRMIQGMAGGMALATNMALITEAIPKEERGRAMGLAVAAVYVGLSAGPFIGGLIATHFGWRWIFFLGTIPLVLAYIYAHINLEGRFRPSDEKFDYIGSVVVSLSVAGVVFGGTHLGSGWYGPVLLCSGIAGFAFFIYLQNGSRHPLVELTLFKECREFSDASLVQFINYAGTFGIVFLFSLYLQTVKGMTPHQAGMVLVVQPVVQAVLSPMCGRMADSFSPRIIALVGMLACTAGTLMGIPVSSDTSLAYLYTMFIILGIGFALFSSPNMMILMGSVPPSRFGFASAMSGGLRTIGMVASMVIIAILMSVMMGHAQVSSETAIAYLGVMRYSLIALSVLCVVAVMISLRAVLRKTSVVKDKLSVQSAGNREEV